jgi:hypothetical protein
MPLRMGVYRFEDLRVWQAAREQCNRVGALILPLNSTTTESSCNFCEWPPHRMAKTVLVTTLPWTEDTWVTLKRQN